MNRSSSCFTSRKRYNRLCWRGILRISPFLSSLNYPPYPPERPQRWLNAGVFEALVNDLRALLRLAAGRKAQPSAAIAAIFDSRTLQSTAESGERAGYDDDGAKRRKGSKMHLHLHLHMAVDTLGHLLALHVTAASEQDRTQVAELELAQPGADGYRPDRRGCLCRPGLHRR